MAVNERELFDLLCRQEGLKKLRHALDPLLGRPTWWLCQKIGQNPSQAKPWAEQCHRTWGDDRARYGRAQKLLEELRSKKKNALAGHFRSKLFGEVRVLRMGPPEKSVGHLILTGLAPGQGEKALPALSEGLRLLTDNVLKTEELTRLSATIRPRAIALSTVHTVHRIINSTLNLSELVSRLAHLTAQVLRVQRCAIYLLESPTKNGRTASLTCRARVGFPGTAVRERRILFGRELEGKVAKSADIQLRKKVLCIPLIDEDVIGVVTVSGKKDKKDFNHFDLEILTTLAEEAVIAIKNAQLYEEQRRVTLGTIQSLALVLGSRVPQNSVISPEAFANLAIRTAQELNLSEDQVQALHYAALLKETTKIGIPDEILKKSSKLTGEEISSLKSHPIQGAKIVQNFESLKTVAPIILYSREKYDGTGYPEGLKAEAIPIGARILSVINAFEAIVVGRPYRGRSSRAEAIQELESNRGTQFDPNVVDAFVRVVKKDGGYSRLTHAATS